MARTPRELDTRDNEKRDRHDSWRPASSLPVPNEVPGIKFRWIRASMLGQSDVKNVSSRFREGWEPVKAEDHPELNVLRDLDSRFPDGVEIGGLILCKTSTENVERRNSYYAQRAQDQINSVDQQYLRENDPRMPMSKPERRTKTTFGRGRPLKSDD